MNYTKRYLAELASKTNFIKDNLEKVLRLSEILRFLNDDPDLRGKLALKGGTAINLTSVDCHDFQLISIWISQATYQKKR